MIDMWFAKNRFFGAAPDNLNVLRDTPAYADDATGRWVQFGNGKARITDIGLLVEDGCTNVVVWCLGRHEPPDPPSAIDFPR
jgi:hypothetical protein